MYLNNITFKLLGTFHVSTRISLNLNNIFMMGRVISSLDNMKEMKYNCSFYSPFKIIFEDIFKMLMLKICTTKC